MHLPKNLFKTTGIFNEIPRKSSCLIMFRPHEISPSSYYNYQILLLKRNEKLKYGNRYAFPGGVRDPSDFHLLHKYYNDINFHSHFDDENKIRLITAFRETLEEIGLLFFSHSITEKRLERLIEIKRRMKGRMLNFREYDYFFPLISQDFISPMNFMRLITAPYLPDRFDTYFYLLKVKPSHVFNWKRFYNNPDNLAFETGVEKWGNLDLEPDEFTESLWLDPLEAIHKYQLSQIDMALPQFLILTILTNFQKHENLEDFLKVLGRVNLFPRNYLLENPFVFPYIAYRTKTDSVDRDLKTTYPYCTLMPGDYLYPVDMVIQSEQDELLQAELKMKYAQLKETREKEEKCRIYFSRSQKRFKAKYRVEVTNRYKSPMSLIKNHEVMDSYFKRIFVTM